MAAVENGEKHKTRFIVSLIACILVGLTFLLSGSGKLIAFGEIPGQTAEFIGYVLPDPWLTTTSVFIIYDILIPWIIPIAELALGFLLLVGFMPRLLAILCIPMICVFIANNVFAISIGMMEYESCECFGIWEEIFGTLTPLQSLYYDIALFALALVIIFVFPGGILQSQKWLRRLGRKKESPAT